MNQFIKPSIKIKAILFDHDGTLVDSEITHFQLWKKVLEKHNVDLAEQGYKDFHSGTPTPRNAEILVEKHSLSITPQALAEEKEVLTHTFLAHNTFSLMPDSLDTIKHFHSMGLKLGVVTGAGRFGVTSTLKGHQLEQYFDVITTGEDVAKSKPDPAVYLLAMKRLGVKNNECIAIEDTENGIRSAIAAGLVCCAVRNDYSAGHDFSIATEVFDCMNDAKNWIIKNDS
jgi:HAD superfamily hydrolase (TIGR01509 family)